ncbi:uncharacterized protein [Cicer arietinum]|uniref:Myb family transcription factor PHL11-like n=1 Tax=Cicer arietinum TaxID=3827 RepID=A0A1S2YZZ1_CICAR|nr:myb family transcription factor PHL11-like [Cicer arietinum]
MRIEVQGKYLQAVLEKAQTNFSQDGQGNLEASKVQLDEFNLALSNFMENMNNKDSKENIVGMSEYYDKNHSSSFNYQEVLGEEEKKDLKPQVEGGSIQLDLNIKGNEVAYANGAEMESKMVSYRVYHF